jgi:acetylornithine deacetylase
MAADKPARYTSVEMIRRLIAFDTVSRNSNLDLLEFVRAYLAEHGVDCTFVYNDDRQKANLYATLGPTDRGGILLSGHTDVVPVEGQDWHTDPFTMAEKDGRLYGRGTADMKSFIAIALALAPEFLERGLETPIHFSFSHDEEVGCIGIASLIDILKDAPVKPAMCIVGEPTEMQVVIAHKGKQYLRAHVDGKECHSSLAPEGVNAVEYAAELIGFIRGVARRSETEGPFDHDFDVPHTTLMTGVVHGGTNLNIVPNHCWFDFEVREIPGDDPFPKIAEIKAFARDELEPRMHAVDPSTGIRFEDMSLRPSLDTRPDEDVVAFVKALAERNDHGKVAFGTEGAHFQHFARIPTVVCGPGSIAQAHKPNEFISLEQIAKCEAFLRRLMDRVCLPAGT